MAQVAWDADRYPNFRQFIGIGQQAGVTLFVYASHSLALEQIEEAMEMLEECMLPPEEKRPFENKLHKLKAYEGFTSALEISFSLNGMNYSYGRESEWYTSLKNILAELDALMEIEEEDEEDADGLGGYFSKN